MRPARRGSVETRQQENVIGVFPDEGSAQAAVRFLERAGITPDAIGVIENRNARRARELAGSAMVPGALIGGFIGLALFGVFAAMGGPMMWSNWVVVALALPGFVLAGVAIGALAGRDRSFVAPGARPYERAAEEGESLVSVHVIRDERDRMRQLLREAGAVEVREEKTVEAA